MIAFRRISSFIAIFFALCAMAMAFTRDDAERVLGSSVTITTDASSGGGTVVASLKDGDVYKTYVVTALHILQERRGNAWKALGGLTVHWQDYANGRVNNTYESKATVVKIDRSVDLALLVLTDYDAKYSHVAALGDDPYILQSVWVIGSPMYHSLSLTAGLVQEYVDNGSNDWVRFTGSVYSGNSGGGAFDENFKLVGIVQMMDGDPNFKIPAANRGHYLPLPVPFMGYFLPVSAVRTFLKGTPVASILVAEAGN